MIKSIHYVLFASTLLSAHCVHALLPADQAKEILDATSNALDRASAAHNLLEKTSDDLTNKIQTATENIGKSEKQIKTIQEMLEQQLEKKNVSSDVVRKHLEAIEKRLQTIEANTKTVMTASKELEKVSDKKEEVLEQSKEITENALGMASNLTDPSFIAEEVGKVIESMDLDKTVEKLVVTSLEKYQLPQEDTVAFQKKMENIFPKR